MRYGILGVMGVALIIGITLNAHSTPLKNKIHRKKSTANIKKQHEIIAKAMNFPMEKIRKRYQKDFNIAPDDALLHEQEFKRFIILAALYPELKLGMFNKDVDNFWHTCILFTHEYTDLCNSINSGYIHHVPEDEDANTLVPESGSLKKFVHYYTTTFGFSPVEKVWQLGCNEICGTCRSCPCRVEICGTCRSCPCRA